ncbi:nyctalopin-like [Megalops cyprinoides]|uniref:nyctalopin-like n=1 Tax=Megalops cyprinoides TaxID=118141 RepID=UPI00186524D3|nr:nyctalopin-like [Megalops cyprinoides]
MRYRLPGVTVSFLLIPPALASWACTRSCPPSCTCSQENGYTVLCDRANLSSLPRFPCEASSISLDRNGITFLSERAFGTLPSLRSLSLQHNNVSFVTPGAFKGLPSLVQLRMAHNAHVRHLHTHTFASLRRLTRLDLSHCQLLSLPDRIFLEQTALRELLCFQNRFRRVPTAIRGVASLTHVYLEQNRIEVLTHSSLLGLTNLRDLNLQQNRISAVHGKAFQDLQNLENFKLNDNPLADLPSQSFKGLGRLKMLNLGGNLLTSVSRTWFGDLVELEVLYLDRNRLDYIEEGAFENLTSLITLHLNSNNLTSLPFSVFQPIYFLGHLYVFRNPWECDCALEWLKVWMESYRLVRDIPCTSPSSVAGLDLSEVTYSRVDGECVDPVELNVTTLTPSSGPWYPNGTRNQFGGRPSKLLQQLREGTANSTEGLGNSTPQDQMVSLVSGGASCFCNGQSLLVLLLCVVFSQVLMADDMTEIESGPRESACDECLNH